MKHIVLVVLILVGTNVMAHEPPDAASSQPPPWWKVATGIIGVPAALLGLYYTYRLAEKTRLESLKLQRELQDEALIEPEAAIAAPAATLSPIKARMIVTRTQEFFIRYIILELAARAWGAIASIITPLISLSTNVLANSASFREHDVIRYSLYAGVSYVSSIGYIAIFILIGWPLLRDICRSLGITPREIFSFKKIQA